MSYPVHPTTTAVRSHTAFMGVVFVILAIALVSDLSRLGGVA